MSVKFIPTFDSKFLQFLKAPNNMKIVALITFVDGECQPPVTFLRDHPIMHISQPVEFAGESERGIPLGFIQDNLHHLVA